MTPRRKRNEVVIWMMLLLLQECQLVLTLNIRHMKEVAPTFQEGTTSQHGDGQNIFKTHDLKRGVNDLADLREVLEAVTNAGELYKQTHANWTKSIQGQACQTVDDEAIVRDVWAGSGAFVLSMYLSSSAVVSYLKGCNALMESQVTQLVAENGKQDALEHIEDVIDLLHTADKNNKEDEENDEDDDDDADEIDPDGPESDTLNEATYLISRNMEVTESLSDVFLSMNDSNQALKSVAGLEDTLEEQINQYQVMTAMLSTGDGTWKKRKRSAENHQHINIKDVQKKVIETHATRMSRSVLAKDSRVVNLVMKRHMDIIRNSFIADQTDLINKVGPVWTYKHSNLNIASPHKFGPSWPETRERRQTSDNEKTQTIFIKNAKYPCKLLTFQGGEFFFSNFNELSVTSQLWVLTGGFVRHYRTGWFLTKAPNGRVLLENTDEPVTKFQFENGTFQVAASSCGVSTDGLSNIVELYEACEWRKYQDTENWVPVSFQESQADIASITCLFFIERQDSCRVLTYVDSYLETKPVNEEIISNQLWYWDFEFIRNSRTHKYLTSDWIDSLVSAVDLDTGINQRWAAQNGKLVALDLPKDSVLVMRDGGTSVGFIKEIDSNDWNITLVNLHENRSCAYSTGYFAITHGDFPCIIMCVMEREADRTMLTKLLVIGVAFSVGIPSAFLFLFCFEVTVAVIAGLAVGIILASIAALVVNFSDLKSFTYLTVTFKVSSDSEAGECLWFAAEGGIKHMKHDQFLSFQKVGSNDFKTLRLLDKSDQRLTLRGKTLRKDDGTSSCALRIVMEEYTTSGVNDAIPFDCSEDNEELETWEAVDLSNPNYAERTSCLYFLRQQSNDQSSCDVLTTKDTLNGTSISTEYPSINHLFNQLWYLRGDEYLNLETGDTLNLTDVDSSMEKVAFTDKEADDGFLGGCEANLYFIKSSEDPCLLMTYMNRDGKESVSFHEFDSSYVTAQLWGYDNGRLRNPIAGFLVTSVNFTLLDLVVFSDDFSSYADEILCPFFIQEKEPPCGLLSANNVTGNVFFGPFTTDLVNSQLWSISGNQFLHLQTGIALSYSEDNSGFRLSMLGDDDNNATIVYLWRKEGNDIFAHSDKYDGILSWRKIYSQVVLEDLSMLQCSAYNRSYYFIKQSDNPCVLLTTGGINEAPFFDTLDEKNVPMQLWYEESDRIINMYSGHVLKMDGRTHRYTMSPPLYYDSLQSIKVSKLENDIWMLRNGNGNCTMNTVRSNGKDELVCRDSSLGEAGWHFLGYDALDDISNLMCLFYIRSQTRPCEFVTGYSEGAVLKVRPMTERLIQQQLFYYKDNYIIHQKTGLILTYGNMSLTLQNDMNMIWYQSLEFEDGNLQVKTNSGSADLAVTFSQTDGLVSVGHVGGSGLNSKWWEVGLNYDFERDPFDYPHCVESTDTNNIDLFFIMSDREECVLLTAEPLGESPIFRTYDKDNQRNQMWFFHDNRIINLETGLALMVQLDELADEHDVVMWNKYTFSAAQYFYLNYKTFEMKVGNKKCKLVSLVTETGITVTLDCNQIESSDLNIVYFDDQGSHVDKITCYFFIKSYLSPCELLTMVGNDLVIRPLTGEFYEGQLWFWKGKAIVNVKSNTMLSVNLVYNRLQLALKPLTSTSTYNQWHEWSFKYGLIQSFEKIDGHSYSVGVRTETGDVDVRRLSVTGHWYNSWTFVKRDEGLKQAEQNSFHCEEKAPPEIYVIRSEHDDCPILNVVGDSKVGYLKVDDAGGGLKDSAWWTWHKDHVCNAQQQLCLEVNERSRQTPNLRPRYAFYRNQRWTRANENIRYLYGSDKLTYTGSQVMLSTAHHGSNQQIWKWYTSSKIKDDPKYLRCSRCYNKHEENAAEVISYIPLIGLFYNIGRSIAYAVKKCPSVALGALRDALIDIAMDAIMILSMGTASAFALGIKTAIKFGNKAGLKAFASAIKSMVKVAIKSLGKNIVKFVKTGFRRTLKRQLTKMKLNIKAVVSSMRKLPATIKSFSKSTLRNVKGFVKVSLRSMKSVGKKTNKYWDNGLKGIGLKFKETFKRIPGGMKRKLNKLGKNLKRQLNTLNDKVAKKAENAIIKADDMKMPKKIRCKRGTEMCDMAVIGNIPSSGIIKTMDEYPEDAIAEMPSALKKDMAEVYAQVATENRQTAAVGLRVSGVDEMSYKDFAKISDEGLRDKADNLIKVDNEHTEPFLLDKLGPEIKKKCSSEKPCKVYMFTKMSPCHDRKDLQESCLSIISKQCKEWLSLYSTKCIVGFEKVYRTVNPFSSWTDVMKQTMKDGKFPSKTANGLKDIDDVLKSTVNTESLTSTLQSDFHKIISDKDIRDKVEMFWPDEKYPDFDDFTTQVTLKTNNMIENNLDSVLEKLSPKLKAHGEELDKLKRLHRDLMTSDDNFDMSVKTTFDAFRDTYKKDPIMKKGVMLYKEMDKIAKAGVKQREDVIKAVAKQAQAHLNAIAGKAEMTKILVEAAAEAADAVELYRYIKPGFDAG